MRIDSSGNLLVGKTSSSSGVEGLTLSGQYNLAAFTRDQNPPLLLNRLNSDGMIAEFRKDGTTVASIGVNGGTLIVGQGTSGIKFAVGASAVIPHNNISNSDTDGALDLGTISGANRRFRDLYLSGGVYLGGTGSANYLDDYEYGTWTPSMNAYSGSVTSYGEYFKVGDMVTASFSITLDGTTDASAWRIANLPFNWDSTVGGSWGGCITKQNAGLEGHSFQVVTTNDVLIYNSSGATRSYTNVGVNSNIRGVVTYKTT
jgi:hypothetical protein